MSKLIFYLVIIAYLSIGIFIMTLFDDSGEYGVGWFFCVIAWPIVLGICLAFMLVFKPFEWAMDLAFWIKEKKK